MKIETAIILKYEIETASMLNYKIRNSKYA